MNYRVNSDFQAPFRIFPYIDEASNYKLEVELRIRACYGKQTAATYLIVKVPMPKANTSIKPELIKVYISLISNQCRERQTRWSSINRAKIL